MIKAIIKPRGFIKNDLAKSPCNMETTDLVEPQEGQGIFVTCFIRQTSAEFNSVILAVNP